MMEAHGRCSKLWSSSMSVRVGGSTTKSVGVNLRLEERNITKNIHR